MGTSDFLRAEFPASTPMTQLIKNSETLLSHGNMKDRKDALEILEAGLKASDPYKNMMELMWLEGDNLIVDVNRIELDPSKRHSRRVYDLGDYKNIYVIGAGKAAQRMAKGVEDILGDRITDGQINAKKGEGKYLKVVPITEAGHPEADEDSVAGSRGFCNIARRARKGDLVFYSISGGYTALSMNPPEDVPLDDLKEVQRMLYFEKGAPIWELNIVRDVISQHKAGRIEEMLCKADVIRLLTNEKWPKGKMEGLESAYTYENAINVLKKWDIWDRCPKSVIGFLERADPNLAPVPKDRVDEIMGRWLKITVMNNEYMFQAAQGRAREMGINTAVLCSAMSGEASVLSEVMANCAWEIADFNRPFEPPFAYLLGGELTVKVGGATGRGGRNQEFALASAQHIRGSEHIIVASADSDGTDGPTDAAGGIVDGYTTDRAEELGIDVRSELENHNSYYVSKALGDAIFTGPRGTNVQDLRVVYISR